MTIQSIRPIVACLAAVGFFVFGHCARESAAWAQTASVLGDPQPADADQETQAHRTVQAVMDLAITMLPHQYDGEKNWEDTKRIWAGVKVRREGLRISTHRRWRELRHGRQTKYQVSFPGDPAAAKPVVATVHSVRPDRDAQGQAGWLIDCELATPLDFRARVERWNLGVQLYSVEISGHMRIRLTLSGRLTSYPDYSELPPAIVIDPTVTSAALHLDEVNVDRVSKIGGEVAETWGEIAEKITEEVFMDDINSKLHAKLNKSIDKKRDRLKWSAGEWVSRLTTVDEQTSEQTR